MWEASDNLNDFVVSMSPKLEQAVVAACVSYLVQTAVSGLVLRRRKIVLLHNITLVSGALAVILEVLNLPPISIHSIVGLLTGFLTYLEITDTDKDNDRTRKML